MHAAGEDDALSRFSAPTRDWFAQTLGAPTPAQAQAWRAISAGDHALVVAPTGSGKTLAAFLWALDGLLRGPDPDGLDRDARCRVLYVSPLKALAADVQRNLGLPLEGIRSRADALGEDAHRLRVQLRTGDTSPADRRRFLTRPPDILITTPESLYLMLTSRAREGLRGVRTVIVDELHALAGTKRGAHLALSLERLDHLLSEPAQRIGLSATVEPVEDAAGFLTGRRPPEDGGRPVAIVRPASAKRIRIEVHAPVPDLGDLATAPLRDQPGAEPDDPGATASVWGHVEERIVDLVAQHRSTLVFANSRRGAERLASRLNESWAQRQDGAADAPRGGPPAQVMGQAGESAGAPPILARAHHGSMSRAERTEVEELLKAGKLPAVVATSSLELGIDMGAVDLVVQVGSPPSVASALQRIGRAGHQVGAESRGVVIPLYRGDLLAAAAIADLAGRGRIEPLHPLANPLDVLAQQIVAMVAIEDWQVADLARMVRRATPFAGLTDGALSAVLDMLSGVYPGEDFAGLRARLVWDRHEDLLSDRPGALRLAVTNGGTIPDRGLYGVFLSPDGETGGPVPADPVPTRGRPARRVGELDEEMVYESRVGDVFTLGSSAWRIEEITTDRVLVTPAPGAPGRLPFWKGDYAGRPAALGRALGVWTRALAETPGALDGGDPRPVLRGLASAGLDAWAAEGLLRHLADQREATGALPDDRTIVCESFLDELGDPRVVVHSPYGARVHRPWALLIDARLRTRYGAQAFATAHDDGIVIRLPTDGDPEGGVMENRLRTLTPEDLLADPEDVTELVRDALAGSAMFGARFRQAASRALLLPRINPARRAPLWQQRLRSANLLAVASRYPEFPIVLEAVRECLQDDFDLTALSGLMQDCVEGRVEVVMVSTPTASPFARALLFENVVQLVYRDDAPLAELRAATLGVDAELLAEVLGDAPPVPLAQLLDPDVVRGVEAELQSTPGRRPLRDPEELVDLLRERGPLSEQEVAALCTPELASRGTDALGALSAAGRVYPIATDGPGRRWAALEDAGRLRDALGVPPPPDTPARFLVPVADALGDLIRRHARRHGPFTATSVAHRLGVPPAAAEAVLDRLHARGLMARGALRPVSLGGTGHEFCDVDVLRRLRRRSLAVLREQIRPVPGSAFAAGLRRRQGVRALRGVDGVRQAAEQLAGLPLPAGEIESRILPDRVVDYSPAMLDQLTTSGEVLWAGHPAPAGGRGLGWVSLHLPDTAAHTLTAPAPIEPGLQQALMDVLAEGGAYFVDRLVERLGAGGLAGDAPPGRDQVVDALWDLVWAGRVTNDSFGPLRARLTPHRAPAPARPARSPRGYRGAFLPPRRPAADREGLQGGGRWSALPAERDDDPGLRAAVQAQTLLERYGVVGRPVAAAEPMVADYSAVYRVLSAWEEAGAIRRGYFVEGLGGAQFAVSQTVDELRGRSPRGGVVLAASDPANPYGASLPWPAIPEGTGHRPSRRAGALVVLDEAGPVLFLERGGRTVLTFGRDPAALEAAARALGEAIDARRLGGLAVQRVDGREALRDDSPTVDALRGAGFTPTPRGLRRRTGGSPPPDTP